MTKLQAGRVPGFKALAAALALAWAASALASAGEASPDAAFRGGAPLGRCAPADSRFDSARLRLAARGEAPLCCSEAQPRISVARLGAAYDAAGIDLGAAVAAQLVGALHATGCFELHEHSELATASVRDPAAALNTIDWVVLGTVSAAEPARRGRRLAFNVPFAKLPLGVGLGGARSQTEVALELRLVDVATGRVLTTLAVRGSAAVGDGFVSVEHEKIGASLGAYSHAPLGEAARAAAEAAARELVAATRGMHDSERAR